MEKSVIVCGASRGIGFAIVEELLLNDNFSSVIVPTRAQSDLQRLLELKEKYHQKLIVFECDLTSERSVEVMANEIGKTSNSIGLIVNCVGFLHNDSVMPEKSIEELAPESFLQSFKINTLPTLLLAKYFKAHLQNAKDSVFVTLSAKVGSIEDNRSGGWYSYRSSKSALNMCIRNISIEFNRMGRSCTVFAIHPGTTATRLSEPFLKNARKKYVIHTAKESAKNILEIIHHAKKESHNGKFLSWNKEEIPW